MRIILASASPRRKELFARLFDRFEIIPAKGREVSDKEQPQEAAAELSAKKAEEIETMLHGEACGEYLIVGADTVVAWGQKIFTKPRDEKDAQKTLGMLSGNTHQVYTGVTMICQINGTRWCRTFTECTQVTFYPMTEEEIRFYVNTKEPMDKAGSYGIQGIGGRFAAGIQGDYNNVVGLPIARIYQILKQDMGFKMFPET